MDELKTKFMDLLHKQANRHRRRSLRIPAMGFSDYFIQTVTSSTEAESMCIGSAVGRIARPIQLGLSEVDDNEASGFEENENCDERHSERSISDQELLETIEDIYYRHDSSVELHELQKILGNEGGIDYSLIAVSVSQLRRQHKVLSKKVLQNILDQRAVCNNEFAIMHETQKELEEALWTCRKARSYLNYARMNLTTNSLEILSAYRKREILQQLLNTLQSIKKLRSTDVEVQKLLTEHNYSEVISLLIDCKDAANEFMHFNCVQSLQKKLQETLLMTEIQLDTVLNEMILNFDAKKYSKLQGAYKLLNKSLIAMDQLHINYISAIHTSVNGVLRSYKGPSSDEEGHKYLYEQLCTQVGTEMFIPCLISLCKTIWTILASYYQIVSWHQSHQLNTVDQPRAQLQDDVEILEGEINSIDLYILEKLKKGQSRIWNDILTKICVYLQSTHLLALKYDQFIQILSIVQRLKKVGHEFCGERSEKLIDIMQQQSEAFFRQYHRTCLEEICLFLDNESWTSIDSFTNILQLPEFRSIRYTLLCQRKSPTPANTTTTCDESVSLNSQDAGSSSICGTYGYFLRYRDLNTSPFDGGFEATREDYNNHGPHVENSAESQMHLPLQTSSEGNKDQVTSLSTIIVDEAASCYFSEESDDEPKSLHSNGKEFDDNSTTNLCDGAKLNHVLINNTTLNVLRCIGRYVQMCKLLHTISPRIVASMLELIDFYLYAVLEIFSKDVPVQMENLYSSRLEEKFKFVNDHILGNIRLWPLNFTSLINNELANPDILYGLSHRIVAVESCYCLSQQFLLLSNYLMHLLPSTERAVLNSKCRELHELINNDISRPIYTCVTSRIIDLSSILMMMGKVKWDINQVSFQHNGYIDILNRNIQSFAMRLEDISKEVPVPAEEVWQSVAHISTHLLVEGFSNVKKCSAAGRALMQLDFTNFMSMLELISQQKYPEYRAYVDGFIKAYYFSMEQFDNWILTQKELEPAQYSLKQLTNLIGCICSTDKRLKNKLLQILGNNNNSANVTTTSATPITIAITSSLSLSSLASNTGITSSHTANNSSSISSNP